MNKQIRRTSSRGRTAEGAPNPIDIHVGNRVRLRRTLLGLSQEKLGEALGLTFQQIQKYEKGSNRIGSSRLWDLSRVLKTDVSYFFEDMDKSTASSSPRNIIKKESGESSLELHEKGKLFDTDPMKREETLELVRDFYKITDKNLANQIKSLISSLAHKSAIKKEGE